VGGWGGTGPREKEVTFSLGEKTVSFHKRKEKSTPPLPSARLGKMGHHEKGGIWKHSGGGRKNMGKYSASKGGHSNKTEKRESFVSLKRSEATELRSGNQKKLSVL